MRHKRLAKKFGRSPEHREQLMRMLCAALVLHDSITTTLKKAKQARKDAEKLVTLARKGTLAARRLAAARLRSPEAVKRLRKAATAATPASPSSAPAAATPPRWPSSNGSSPPRPPRPSPPRPPPPSLPRPKRGTSLPQKAPDLPSGAFFVPAVCLRRAMPVPSLRHLSVAPARERGARSLLRGWRAPPRTPPRAWQFVAGDVGLPFLVSPRLFHRALHDFSLWPGRFVSDTFVFGYVRTFGLTRWGGVVL